MFETHVFARSTAHSAVLYWDKPAAAGAGAQYTVYLGGQPVATCGRTHFTLTDLRSQNDYQADVFFGHQCVGSCVFRTTPVKNRLDVTEAPFWAKGDGKTKNTAALQRAIDACGAGDAVYIPAGIYLTGALRLHSNMELYLDEGAILQGTAEIVDYQPRIPSRFEGTEMRCYSSLLNLGTLDHAAGPNCENVVIRGKGTIASGGRELAEKIIADEQEHLQDYLAEHAALVAECENERTIPGRVRPRLINMSNCRNVWVHGLTLKNGASWNQHMIYSDNITTDHIMPAGAKILPLRSNIPAISQHCFTVCDEDFPRRAKNMGKSIIVGGSNYGQGSSREHAALAPLYLGIKAVLVKSFARIHRANLINAGILPLTFVNEADYDKINQGDEIVLADVRADVEADMSKLTVVNKTTGVEIPVLCELTGRTKDIILAGGLLDYTREQLSK